jgi:hypothetical protein
VGAYAWCAIERGAFARSSEYFRSQATHREEQQEADERLARRFAMEESRRRREEEAQDHGGHPGQHWGEALQGGSWGMLERIRHRVEAGSSSL